jgi:hypothetical protein
MGALKTADATLPQFQARLAAGGPTPGLQAAVRRAVQARQGRPGGHAAWGRLCEAAGLAGLAFAELQQAVRDAPADAAFRLARLNQERGDGPRAAGLLGPLLERQPAHPDWLALFVAVQGGLGADRVAREALDRARRHGRPADQGTTLALTAAADTVKSPVVNRLTKTGPAPIRRDRR